MSVLQNVDYSTNRREYSSFVLFLVCKIVTCVFHNDSPLVIVLKIRQWIATSQVITWLFTSDTCTCNWTLSNGKQFLRGHAIQYGRVNSIKMFHQIYIFLKTNVKNAFLRIVSLSLPFTSIPATPMVVDAKSFHFLLFTFKGISHQNVVTKSKDPNWHASSENFQKWRCDVASRAGP